MLNNHLKNCPSCDKVHKPSLIIPLADEMLKKILFKCYNCEDNKIKLKSKNDYEALMRIKTEP